MQTAPQNATTPTGPAFPSAIPVRSERPIMLVQGLYYLATGIWPVINIASFEAVTGPKYDTWLVRTVGLVLTVVGLTLLIAARKMRAGMSTAVLAIGTALVLAVVDVVFVAGGQIRPVYLLDAVAEIGLVAWWIWSMLPAGPEVVRFADRGNTPVPPRM